MVGRDTKQASYAPPKRRGRGFSQASGILDHRMREATKKRGFQEMQILTHWDEIAGPDLAAKTSPVKLSYARGSFGATLTILVEGALAPLVDMQKPQIIERVNALYGRNAVSRIHLTQTTPKTGMQGFAQDQAAYQAAKPSPKPLSEARKEALANDVKDIENDDLKQALARLGSNILTRRSSQKE